MFSSLIGVAQTAPASAESTTSTAKSPETVVELSPFEVRSDDHGYRATNTVSGTRLNSKLSDLAASISVITKQQLDDTAAVDLNDIFSTELNTEGIYQYTEFTNDRGNIVDSVAQTPETSNRIRGLGNANISTNGFASSSAIPVDTYNLDSVEISRGPNSNLFGVGQPSGTINLIRGRANFSRETTQTSFRVDDRGGYRVSVDINRPIIKDKVALRFAAVHDDVQFVRKPSFDRTNRFTVSLALQPFKDTIIRGSYESYSNYASRANSTTPRDYISEWRAAGSPVWDPTFSNNTGGYRLLNGTTYTSVTQAQESTLFPRGLIPNSSGFFSRTSIFANPDGTIGRYEVNRGGVAVVPPAIPNPGSAGAQLRYAQIGTLISRGGGAFGSPGLPLFVQPGVTDKSIYDWTDINLAAPNIAHKGADIYQAEIEQMIIHSEVHQLAFQGGIKREVIKNDSRSFVAGYDGAPAIIQLDVNEKYLDGNVNPYFLHPYIGGSEVQTYKRPELNDQGKVNLAYQLDLTKQPGWTRWIGRQNVVGYLEYRENTRAPTGLRYRDQIVSAEPWHSAANLANIPGRGAGDRFYTRYYIGDSVAQPGQVVDYASSAPNLRGPQTIRYYNGTQVLNEPVEIGDAYFALGKQESQLRTKGFVWQGFLLEERVIPAIGIRNDKYRVHDNITVPLRSDGYLDETFLDKFPQTWTESSGDTRTKGIVVAPFKGWKAIDRRADDGSFAFDVLRSVRFHYNTSDSFQPQSLAYNLFAEVLPNTFSKGKDYGFSFSAFKEKFNFKFTKYDQTIDNDRSGSTAVVGTRPIRLDFDASGDNSVFGTVGGDKFDLEDDAFVWFSTINPGLTLAQYATQVYSYIGITPEAVAALKGKTLSDVNNTRSRGTEIELSYTPNAFWTLKANVAEQQAIDTSLSPNIQRYIDLRLPIWTTLRVPTTPIVSGPNAGQLLPDAGRLWWEVGAPGSTGGDLPMNFYASSIDSPYKLAITQTGKPRPQTRRYHFNLTTNYQLAGLHTDIGWLNNLSVGGSLRWQDKAAVGFLGKAPEADGVVRALDGNKPIYDKARYSVDLMASYKFKMWRDRIRARVQLNVRDVFEDGRLQAVAYNPDGNPYAFRIVDPREFILSTTFDF